MFFGDKTGTFFIINIQYNFLFAGFSYQYFHKCYQGKSWRNCFAFLLTNNRMAWVEVTET